MHLHKVTLHSITICCIRLRCYNPTAHTVNPYCTLVISYCTFCVVLHTILGPGTGVMEMGRKSVYACCFGGKNSGIGWMLACFHCCRTVEVSRDQG